jgi:hypothetical protein
MSHCCGSSACLSPLLSLLLILLVVRHSLVANVMVATHRVNCREGQGAACRSAAPPRECPDSGAQEFGVEGSCVENALFSPSWIETNTFRSTARNGILTHFIYAVDHRRQ